MKNFKSVLSELKKNSITMGCEFTAQPGKTLVGWKRLTRTVIEKYTDKKWIHKNVMEEDSLLECPTPICKSFTQMTKYWNDFSDLVKNIDGSYYYNVYDSGGGHIHLSIPSVIRERKLEREYLKAIWNIFLKYPSLGWGFNSPRDNENAVLPMFKHVSLLAHMNKYAKKPSLEVFSCDKKIIVRDADLIEKYVRKNMFTNSICANRLNIDCYTLLNDLDTLYAMRTSTVATYRPGLKTIEYRFLAAPTTLKHLQLNLEVCARIHLEALKAVLSKKEIKHNNKTIKDINQITYVDAKKNLASFGKDFNISSCRFTRQYKNLKVRFFPEEYFTKGIKNRALLN